MRRNSMMKCLYGQDRDYVKSSVYIYKSTNAVHTIDIFQVSIHTTYFIRATRSCSMF